MKILDAATFSSLCEAAAQLLICFRTWKERLAQGARAPQEFVRERNAYCYLQKKLRKSLYYSHTASAGCRCRASKILQPFQRFSSARHINADTRSNNFNKPLKRLHEIMAYL